MDKVAVITGGSHGIGKAIASLFKEEGFSVETIDIQPGSSFTGDISDPKTLEQFHEYVMSRYDHINCLINNAPPLSKGIDTCSYEEFSKALSVGVTAPFYLSRLFKDDFADGSSIINISSSRDRMSQPQTESYTAAKGGIAVAIQSELDIPVKYIGVGETIDDLEKFDPDQYVEALFRTEK